MYPEGRPWGKGRGEVRPAGDLIVRARQVVTVLVGVCCSDGVVIGCDSVATPSAGQFSVMHVYDSARPRCHAPCAR
jgi:hypothetical protein